MHHVSPTTGRDGCNGNTSLRFEAALSRETHSRPIHYKAPHEINPQEHPRIINGVPYAVPLSRLEPYNDSIGPKKNLKKNRRGSAMNRFSEQNWGRELGWNFSNHRTDYTIVRHLDLLALQTKKNISQNGADNDKK